MKKFLPLVLILFVAAEALGQWRSLNTTGDDPTDSFINIEVLNDSTIYATAVPFQFSSGDQVIHRSFDSGESWSTIDIEVTNGSLLPGLTPLTIGVVDEETLWAGMANLPSSLRGALVRTEDGGDTWELVELPIVNEKEIPCSIHFFNQKTGVVITHVSPFGFNDFYQSQRSTLESTLQIYFTSDGGDSWRNATPELETGESRWFSQGNAQYDVKGDTIWYGTLHGRVLRSTNKGEDWEIFDVYPGEENNINSITFKDAQNGVAVVSSPITIYPTFGMRTTDGGSTWTRMEIPERIENIYYVPGSDGVYVASMNWNGNYGYFISKDDGENWQRVQAQVNLYTIQFLSPEVGYAGGLNSEGGIFKYEGQSLQAETTEPEPTVLEGQGVGILPDNYRIDDISIVDENIIWAIARLGPIGSPVPEDYVPHVLRTTDGGANWEIMEIGEAKGRFFWNIHAFDENTAFTTSQNFGSGNKRGVFRTTDGGTTWTEVYNNVAGGVWMHFFDEQEGIVINRQLIAKTFDGGDTWSYIEVAPTFQNGEFTIIYFGGNSLAAHGDHLWFGTNGGRVFHSSDRGDNWEVNVLDNNMTVHSLAFKDTLNGLAIGSQRTLFRTEDGGKTWVISPSTGFPYALQSIAFVPGTKNSYIATSTFTDFAMIYTNDGGATWQEIPDVNALGVIEFSSPSLGWIARGGFAFSESAAIYKWIGEPFPEAITTHTENKVLTNVKVRLSPNPTSSELTVQASFEGIPKEVTLTITDVRGKVWQQQKVLPAIQMLENLDVKSLPSGVYWLQIQTDNGVSVQQFAKH